VQVTADQVECG
jgi:hypothetical protein